ncbi:Suppressor of lurcher protein 1 [Aphelenchoides bicaudatus]|nr:Suppressor of lurcher protein 1 [Aphelenchoides bicaudatus]
MFLRLQSGSVITKLFFLLFVVEINATKYSCPVRIISNNAHSSSSLEEDDPATLLTDDYDGLPEGGENLQPFSNNTGFISSEQSIRKNYKCEYIFLGAPNEHVQLIFRKFRLFHWNALVPNSTVRCEEEDHVSTSILVGSRMSKVNDFCRDELPPPLISAKNLLTLDYVVKSIGPRIPKVDDDYGFEVEYRFLKDYGPIPTEAISVPNTSCSFVFNGSIQETGNLWSPNHPGYYPRNLNCEYIFLGTERQIVIIHFEYFDVEGFGQCEDKTHSDYVLFSNYKTIDRTNKRFCGDNRPLKSPIQSESNYFRMQFFANDIFDATGFYAHYQFLDQRTSKSNRVKLTSSNSPAIFNIKQLLMTFTLLTISLYIFIDCLQ